MRRVDPVAEKRNMHRLLIAALLIPLLAGCGDHHSEPAATRDRIVIKVEPASVPKTLPQSSCFTGIYSYDVMLLGDQMGKRDCARFAAKLFPSAEQLPWSPEKLRDPDQVVECELSLMQSRLLVWRGDPDMEGPRFERAHDLSARACARLRHEGCKLITAETLDP